MPEKHAIRMACYRRLAPLLGFAVAAMLHGPAGRAAVRMPGMFSDRMVLQRDAPIRIFGRAEPGEAVNVYIGDGNVATETNKGGLWAVTLPPMDADGPYELVVKGGNTITFRDVLVGDVWFFSGQSNMVFPLRSAASAAAALPQANHPKLRFFVSRYASSPRPSEDIVGSGPRLLDSEAAGDRVRLRFDRVGSGLAVGEGDALRGFALAGQDRGFHWADAWIDNDTVLLRCEAVAEPVWVCYGWASSPVGNLANREGLPALPFHLKIGAEVKRADPAPNASSAKTKD